MTISMRDADLSLATICNALTDYQYEEAPRTDETGIAAVAAVLRERQGTTEILFIHRAEHPLDPWSGHMSFPGGRIDPGDASPLAAAKREAEEEVALDLDQQAELIGRLSDLPAMARGRPLPLVIVPFVFQLTGFAELQPNHEVQEVVWVPLGFLADRENLSTLEWRRGEREVTLPCVNYCGHTIWGLTLLMVDELLALVALEQG
jgi:8-oxo-dGTP pyrophosphatase MutT (NUDIX family)